jgi:broad specificity phosphatase PhoE
LHPKGPIAFMVRHGRTVLNDPQNPRLRAWENPPLCRLGQLDAAMAAQKLKRFQPQMIYSSDLTRDLQTAEILAQELGNLPNEVAYELRTADMGHWSGELEEDVGQQVGRWYREPWIHPPGEGESNNEFLRRFLPWFDDKLELARDVEGFRPSIFVAHGRNLAAVHARANKIPQIEGMMSFPGGIMMISIDDRGEPKVDYLGETEPVQQDV